MTTFFDRVPVTKKSTIPRRKLFVKTQASMALLENNNTSSSGDLVAGMDAIHRMIRGYKGKAKIAAVMMAEMQRKFDDKLVALE